MSSNLGSLVLELSANVARFQSDMGRVVQSATESADKIVKTFERVGAAVGVGIGADAFKDFIGGAIEAQDAALKTAQKIGVATESMAGLSSAAQKAGVDTAGFETAMVKLSKSSAEAANGVAQQALTFKAMGVAVKDAEGNIKGSEVLLGEIADKFKGYRDGVEKTALAVALFGKAGAQMIPLLNGGSAAIQHQIELTKQLGASFTKEGAEAAEHFKDTMSDLSLVSKGVGNTIATAILPALNRLADKAMEFFTSDTWKSWLSNISSAFTSVANHLDDIIAGIKLLGDIAVDYIGGRLVLSVTTAAARMAALTVATLAANSAAAEMGISFSTGVAASLKQIGYLNAGVGSVVAGIAGWQIGTYLYDQFSVVRQISQNFIATLDAMWTVVKASAEGAWLYIQKSFYTMLDAITGHLSDSLAGMAASFAKLPDALGGSKLSAEFLALSAAIAPSGKGVADLDEKITALKTDAGKNLQIIAESWNTGAAAQHRMATSFSVTSDEAKKAAPNVAGLGATSEAAANAARQLAEMFDKDAEAIALLRGKLDPVAGAYQEYVKNVIAANAAYSKEIDLAQKAGATEAAYSQIKKDQADRIDAARQSLERNLTVLAREQDIVTRIAQKEAEELSTIGLTGQALEEATRLRDAAAMALENYNKGLRNSAQLTAEETAKIIAGADAFYKQKTAAELSAEAAKGWQSIWSNAANSVADTFAKVVVEGGSLFNSLKDLAKQTVEQIIAYFAKLAIINPILNAIFGGSVGFSMLPTMANAAGIGGGDGFGGLGSIIGMFTGGGGGASTGGFSLFSPSSWIDAGKSLYNGFTSMFSGGGALGNATNSTFAGMSEANPGGYFTSQVTGAQSFAGATATGPLGYGGYGSALGQGLGVAGGIYAGYNEFQNAGGGLAGLAGGAAYGVGTYFAGAAVSSALAGGLSAGLAAIPVVGWIAIAAMLIDKFSGGKLFGTSWQTKTAGVDLSLADGGTATTWEYQQKQGALFSGMKDRTKYVASSQDAIDAAKSLFDSIAKVMTDGAKRLQETVPPMIEGAISIANTYDKHGKVTGTSYNVTVGGKTYKEANQDDATTRLAAEALIATVAASEVGKQASAIAEQWRSSAKTLMDGANLLLAATADIQSKNGLLGLNGTLADTVTVVEKYQIGQEALLDTYNRLQQEVAVLKSGFDTMGLQLKKTGADLVQVADDFAAAAGGAQQAAQLQQSFEQAFYSAQEIAQHQADQLKQQVGSELSDLGLGANTTMAQFRTAFEAVASSLNGAELAKWEKTGVDLANLFQALNQADTQFTQSMQSLVQNTQQIAAQLFGTGADQIQARIQQLLDFGKSSGIYDFAQITALKKQLTDQQAQQQAAQRLAGASTLLGNFGQLGALTGESLKDLAAQFNVPLDKLAEILHTNQDGLAQQFQIAEQQANAALGTQQNTDYANKLLADILAAQQGLAAPFSALDLQIAHDGGVSAAAIGGKGGAIGYGSAATSGDVYLQNPAGTRGGIPKAASVAQPANTGASSAQPVVDAINSNTEEMTRELRELRREFATLSSRVDRYGMAGPMWKHA